MLSSFLTVLVLVVVVVVVEDGGGVCVVPPRRRARGESKPLLPLVLGLLKGSAGTCSTTTWSTTTREKTACIGNDTLILVVVSILG